MIERTSLEVHGMVLVTYQRGSFDMFEISKFNAQLNQYPDMIPLSSHLSELRVIFAFFLLSGW